MKTPKTKYRKLFADELTQFLFYLSPNLIFGNVYCINGLKPIADLSIEVVFTSGGLEKLPRYQALGVPEVWFWEDGTLQLHHLRSTEYERIDRSELPGLEDLDIGLLKRCILVAETDAGEAIRVFQQSI